MQDKPSHTGSSARQPSMHPQKRQQEMYFSRQLRAPLNAITSSSYRLLEGGMGELNAAQMQGVKNILEQANQLRWQLKELQLRLSHL